MLRAAAAAQSWHPESLVNEFVRFSRTGEMSSAGAPAPWSEGRDPAHPKGAVALVFGRVRERACVRVYAAEREWCDRRGEGGGGS